MNVKTYEEIVALAQTAYEDGIDLVIDPDPDVNLTEDGSGAWVCAWVYVDLEEENE